MRLRRRVAAAIGLATFLPVLAGCGEDAGDLEVGDVVPARDEGQFADGRASFVMLPIGRLEVSLGEPVTGLGDRDTRDLTPQQAPAGATFVPITWQYDAGTFGAYEEYLGDQASPVIDLVSDGASYRLPPPAEVGESSGHRGPPVRRLRPGAGSGALYLSDSVESTSGSGTPSPSA